MANIEMTKLRVGQIESRGRQLSAAVSAVMTYQDQACIAPTSGFILGRRSVRAPMDSQTSEGTAVSRFVVLWSLWVGFVEAQVACRWNRLEASAHQPEACLPPSRLSVSFLVIIAAAVGPPAAVRRSGSGNFVVDQLTRGI